MRHETRTGPYISDTLLRRRHPEERIDEALPVIPSEGAKRRSRGIAVVRVEWLSIGTVAIPRLAAIDRNDPVEARYARVRSNGVFGYVD